MGVTIAEITVADPPEAWEAAGFVVGPDAVVRIGTVGIRLVGRAGGLGIVGWSLRDVPPGSVAGGLDGIPTAPAPDLTTAPAPDHPNGVTSIDHVVLLSPHLARTVDALAALDLQPRRHRDGDLGGVPMRQVFYRLGEVILEVVGSPDAATDEPSTLWGLTHVVADIDATAALLDESGGRVKDAVQPGRRITTLRHRDFDMSVRTAFITPQRRP